VKIVVADYKESNIHPEIKELNGIFIHGKTKEGHPVCK
jgi:hypothetical protein